MSTTIRKRHYDDKKLILIRPYEEMRKIAFFDLFIDGILGGQYRFISHPYHAGYRVASFPGRNMEMDEIDFILALMEELFTEGYKEGKDRIRNALNNYTKNGSTTFNSYSQTKYKANTSDMNGRNHLYPHK